MAYNVGTVYLSLKVDNKSLNKSLSGVKTDTSKKMEDAGKKGGSSFGSAFTVAAGNLIASGASKVVDAVKNIAVSSIKSFADFEQNIGGIETLFGKSAGVVAKNAQKAFRTAGVSANDYMAQTTSFTASLLQGLGKDTAKAAKYADRAIIDMSDNANKFGTDIGRIQDAYQGFAKQNYTMLDNLKLGYGGTKTEMERLLKDAEEISGKKFDVSNFADITEAIHIVQEEMKITGTTSKEAADTLSGSFNSSKAAVDNFFAALGTGDVELVQESLDGIGESVKNLAKNVAKYTGNVGKSFKEMLPPEAQQALDDFFKAVEPLITGIKDNLDGLTKSESFKTLVKAVGILIGGGLLAAIGGLLGVINAITFVVQQAFQMFDEGWNNLKELWDWFTSEFIPGIVSQISKISEKTGLVMIKVKEFFRDAWENIKKFFAGVPNFFKEKFTQAVNNIKNVFGKISGFFGGVIDSIKQKFTNIGQSIAGAVGGAFRSAVNGALGSAENIINGFLSAINGAIGLINKIPGVNIGQVGMVHFGRLAKGGYVDGASLNVIGEAGKEVALPLERNTDNWAGLLASTLASEFENRQHSRGNNTVYMTVQVNNDMDAQDIGRVLSRKMRSMA